MVQQLFEQAPEEKLRTWSFVVRLFWYSAAAVAILLLVLAWALL